ncbi:MAG TPA: glycosyltransferase [Spirochaetota bacterium]|nr:glycosyltransferase [Spirochaetota bacterium]
MISVVCVFNNERVYKEVLLKSLRQQTVPYELIIVDNRRGLFTSAAKALNHAGKQATGDYIMFVHQDMMLGYNRWLEDAELILKMLPDCGIAGVAGISEESVRWQDRLKHSLNLFEESEYGTIGCVNKPVEVQTLDECLLIIPTKVFNIIKFDDTTFDGWDSYGADFCLTSRNNGYKIYVIPCKCSHCCVRGKVETWELKEFFRFQKKLYNKHKKQYPVIYTYLGTLTSFNLFLLNILILFKPLYIKVFPRFKEMLVKHIRGNNSILDLGCGHFSLLSAINHDFSVGVDINYKILQETKNLFIHSQYILSDLREIQFKSDSFDVVLLIDVLDKLLKDDGEKLILRIEKWARKKIIFTVQNGLIERNTPFINHYNKQQSVWEIKEFHKMGFIVRGIGGWKGRQKTIKYSPEIEYNFFKERLNNITRPFVYFFPSFARELLVIKKL